MYGCFHRSSDLKPSNIGLSGAGHIKVFDLGLSVVRQVLEAPTRVYEVRREGMGEAGSGEREIQQYRGLRRLPAAHVCMCSDMCSL